MTADLVAVAEAVKEGLEGNVFSQLFTPRRVVDPVVDLRTLKSLRVDVLGRKERLTRLDRQGNRQVEYDIDVAVRKKLAKVEDTTEHDALVLLIQELSDWFFTHPLPDRRELLAETSSDATGSVAWSVPDLAEQRAFVSVVTLTFRGTRG